MRKDQKENARREWKDGRIDSRFRKRKRRMGIRVEEVVKKRKEKKRDERLGKVTQGKERKEITFERKK